MMIMTVMMTMMIMIRKLKFWVLKSKKIII